jgi:phospho-N-acetylmuramoyl-pentapeptide-transferase
MDINEIITYMMLSAAISLLISIPIIYLLYKYKIVRLIDKDFATIIDKRRLKMGTPIMGGLIVVIAVLSVNLIFNFNGTTKIPLLVFLISALLGAFDDILNIYGRERPVRSIQRTFRLAKVHSSIWMRIFYFITLPWAAFRWIFYLLGSNPGKGIQAHEKIIIQLLVGGLVAWWIYGKSGWMNPSEIWIPWVGNIDLGLFIIPVIIFVVIGTANAVNFSDGMDGLAAGLTIFAFFGYLVIAYFNGETPIAILSASVVGSLIVYLYFNIPPARFQMGDVGSLALGTLLATVAFALNRVALLPVIGFVFVAEILSTVIQGVARRLLGRRLFKMAPIHLHFEMIGWPEYKVVMRAWVIAAICTVVGVWLSMQ